MYLSAVAIQARNYLLAHSVRRRTKFDFRIACAPCDEAACEGVRRTLTTLRDDETRRIAAAPITDTDTTWWIQGVRTFRREMRDRGCSESRTPEGTSHFGPLM
jgi:hypothetical protein